MTDQFRLPFHKKLSEFVAEHCFDETELRIFEVFIQEEYSLTLEDLVRHIFGRIPDSNEEIEYGREHEESQIREGIEVLQRIAVPILRSKDGDYYLGDDEEAIEDMLENLNERIEILHERLNSMNLNFGRLLERL